MKPVIFSNTTKEKVLKQLSIPFRALIEEIELEDYSFSLFVFPQDRRKVVDEGDAKKTVDLGFKENSVSKFVLADSLTQEATQYFQNNDYLIVARELDFWNDESLHNIKQGKY